MRKKDTKRDPDPKIGLPAQIPCFDDPDAGKNHEPTPFSTKVVFNAACMGIPHERISRLLGVTKPTLYKHYRDVLDTAKDWANVRVHATLFDMAVSGFSERATIFWAQTKLGMSEANTALDEMDEEKDPVFQMRKMMENIEQKLNGRVFTDEEEIIEVEIEVND